MTRPVACATGDEAQDDLPLNGDLPLVAEWRDDPPENGEAQDDLPPAFDPLDDSAEDSELRDGVNAVLAAAPYESLPSRPNLKTALLV